MPKKEITINGEAHDVTGKVVIVRGATDREMDFISKMIYKAGARLVLYADDGVMLETLDKKALEDIGLTFKEKAIVDDETLSINQKTKKRTNKEKVAVQ